MRKGYGCERVWPIPTLDLTPATFASFSTEKSLTELIPAGRDLTPPLLKIWHLNVIISVVEITDKIGGDVRILEGHTGRHVLEGTSVQYGNEEWMS